MLARTSCRLIKLHSMATTGLHTGTGGYQQSNRVVFHSSRFLRPPTLYAGFRQKSTASAEIRALRMVWNKMFGKYLLATNVISSGVLMVIGDLIAQELRYRRCEPCDRRYDWKRLGRMFVAGALQGPLHHYVYNWMDKVMPVQNLRNIGRKILIDQLFMSPACILIFFYSACYLEQKSVTETNRELIEKFPYIYLLDWAIWPAAQYINFRYLDTKYRVMYVNIVTALYNVYISYMKHEFDIENL